MLRKQKYIATRMDTDSAPDKREPTDYYYAKNIQTVANGRNLSFSPILTESDFADIYSNSNLVVFNVLYIANFGGYMIFLGTGVEQGIPGNSNHIIVVDSSGYVVRSSKIPIDPEYMKVWQDDTILDCTVIMETADIIKAYIADGINQLIVVDILSTSDSYTVMTGFTPTEPDITRLQGGSLIAGRVQYAYSLYNVHGNSTPISALSRIVSVIENDKGALSGETVNASMRIDISVQNTEYEYLRIYSIHYQELDQLPKITLIYDTSLSGSSTVSIIDDGNLFLSELSVESFQMLGGKLFYPSTIESKNNRLFAANYTVDNFDLDIESNMNLDVRAYAWSSVPALILKDIEGNETPFDNTYAVPYTHDAINIDYDTYKFQEDGTTIGLEGKNVSIRFEFVDVQDENALMPGEIYRLGIVFYDKFGRRSSAKWVCDFKVPYDTSNPVQGAKLLTFFKSDNLSDFQANGVTHVQFGLVKRSQRDMSVSSFGVLVPAADYVWSYQYVDEDSATGAYQPYYTTKFIKHANSLIPDIEVHLTHGVDFSDCLDQDDNPLRCAQPRKKDDYHFFYSPEGIFDQAHLQGFDKVVIIGTVGIFQDVQTKLKNRESGVISQEIVNELMYQYPDTSVFDGFVSCMLDAISGSPDNPPSTINQYISVLRLHSPTTYVSESSFLEEIDLKLPAVSLPDGAFTVLDGSKVTNSVEIPNMIAENNDNITVGFSAAYCGCQVLKFNSTDWASDGVTNYGKFNPATIAEDVGYLPLVQLKRDVTNRYGGDAFHAKNTANYILNGKVVKIEGAALTREEGLGDVFVGDFRFNRVDGLDIYERANWNLYEYLKFKTVSYINVNSRADNLVDYDNGLFLSTDYGTYRLEDNHVWLSAYMQSPNLIFGVGRPDQLDLVEDFSNTIIASKVKYPNEVIDSWTDFLNNETYQLDRAYGSINKLYKFKDEIFAFQDSAVAVILIQPQVQIQSQEGLGIELGTGQVLHTHKYLSTNSGTKFPHSISDDGEKVVYYNHLKRSIDIHTGQTVSVLKNVSNFFIDNVRLPGYDTSVVYAKTAYNRTLLEFVFSITDANEDGTEKGFVITYSNLVQGFIREEDYYRFPIEYNNGVYSLGGIKYNIVKKNYSSLPYKDASIQFVFAPDFAFDKIFHYIDYRINGKNNFSELTVEDNIGRTGTVSLSANIRNKYGINRVHFPRVDGTHERFRDTHILATFVIPSSDDNIYVDDLILNYDIKK